jgi:hypothetical protein
MRRENEKLCRQMFQEAIMSLIGRRFALSSERGRGIFCGEGGVFVGGVPMFERAFGNDSSEHWRPRPRLDLNRDLSKRYGLPIEIDSRMERLAGIGRALDRGDLAYAMMATLHLNLPDPPDPTKLAVPYRDPVDLARNLKVSGLLKADWDPSRHPRWPAGSPGGIGGEFAPAGGGDSTSTSAEPHPGSEVAQTIPRSSMLIEFRLLRLAQQHFQSPSKFRAFNCLRNCACAPSSTECQSYPYPTKSLSGTAECVKEWAEATEDCLKLWADGLLGTDDYRGMGRTPAECIMGRVSENCGGNRLDA